MRAKLLPIDAGEPIHLERTGRIVLGRSGQLADVVLPHSSVSKCHCEIVISQDRVVVRDLNSHNGTRVNRRLITEAELNDGDELAVAEMRFLVRIASRGADDGPSFFNEMLATSGVSLADVDDGALDVHAVLERAAPTALAEPRDDPHGFDRSVPSPPDIAANFTPQPGPGGWATPAKSPNAVDNSPPEIPHVAPSVPPVFEPTAADGSERPLRQVREETAGHVSNVLRSATTNTAAEILHDVNSMAVRAVKTRVAENAGDASQSRFAWPVVPLPHLLIGAAVIAVVGVSFLLWSRISAAREREIFDTYTRIWDELKAKRAGSAAADEWDQFAKRANGELRPIVEYLTGAASSERRTKQVLLWAGRDCLPKMLISARSEPTREEATFARYMAEVQGRLAAK
jgi:hypothetical protein